MHPIVQSLFTSYPLSAPLQIFDCAPLSTPVVYPRTQTGDASPICAKARRLPPDKLEAAKKKNRTSLQLALSDLRKALGPHSYIL